MDFLRAYKSALAFILVSIAAAVAITISANHTARVSAREAAIVLHQSELHACQRSNSLRAAVNVHIVDSSQTRNVLVAFLSAAEIARRDAYTITHAPSDLQAANAYLAEEAKEKKIHYPPVPIINCSEAFPAP